MKHRSTGFACLLLSVVLVAGGGCTRSPSSSEKPSEETASKSVPAAAEKTPPAASAEKPSTTRPVSPAIKELEAKIQPEGTPEAPKTPSKEVLQAQMQTTIKALVDALQNADQAGAEKLLFSSDDFKTSVKPGFRDILEGNILAANGSLVKKLIQQIGGKPLTHAWKSGNLVLLPGQNLFRQSVPTLSNSTLTLTTGEGVDVEVHVDQLVYLEGSWKVFRLSLP